VSREGRGHAHHEAVSPFSFLFVLPRCNSGVHGMNAKSAESVMVVANPLSLVGYFCLYLTVDCEPVTYQYATGSP
jgi:hypothetical protein